jgi:hypothetical protein
MTTRSLVRSLLMVIFLKNILFGFNRRWWQIFFLTPFPISVNWSVTNQLVMLFDRSYITSYEHTCQVITPEIIWSLFRAKGTEHNNVYTC